MNFTLRSLLVEPGRPDKQLLSLTLDLPSVNAAREAARKMSGMVPEIAVAIKSEDGTVNERWQQLTRGWKQFQ